LEKIPVGISSCLLGHPVRYDGGHKLNSYIEQTLGSYFEFRLFCPEMAAGMGVPRPPIQLHSTDNGIRCVGVKDPTLDVTDCLQTISSQQDAWLSDLCAYILKKDSPSCGMERVKVYKNQLPTRNGVGIFAAHLQQSFPNLPMEDEGRLGDPVLRENFVQRVYVMWRWRQLCQRGLTPQALMRFHSQHKLIAMSHNQNLARELGRIVAKSTLENITLTAQAYLAKLMGCLKLVASRGNHVNVLQHIQGYLKNYLDVDDKLELIETIESYRQNQLPLIVPLTLLRHHFRKQPHPFIQESYYMHPYPGEMTLLNEI
jgi:uncharacterized protein YbgA (DUF1722 family)/uncharacterized protein YbbK (DUF523 family)